MTVQVMSLHSRKGPGVSVPPTCIFAAAFALGAWWDARRDWPIHAGSFAEWLAIAGVVSVTFGIILFAAGMTTFARARTGILRYDLFPEGRWQHECEKPLCHWGRQ